MKSKPIFKMVAIAALSALFLGVLATAQHGQQQGRKHGHGHRHGSGTQINKLIHLTPGPAGPNANGIAKVFMKTNGEVVERFQVVGANLTVGAFFTLVVDGNTIETKQAVSENGDDDDQGDDDMGDDDDQGDNGGAVEFLFVKPADGENEDGEPLPAVLDPVTNIRHVELHNASGMIVLFGDFPQ